MDELYPDVAPQDLEPYYSRHVDGMTRFALHNKADIAEQLAWRDQKIDILESQREQTEWCRDNVVGEDEWSRLNPSAKAIRDLASWERGELRQRDPRWRVAN